MEFKFNNFRVLIEKEVITAKDKNDKPIMIPKISNVKWGKIQYKDGLVEKKQTITIFKQVDIFNKQTEKYEEVTSNVFTFIDLIEILKGFAGNKLTLNKNYKIDDSFTGKIMSNKNNIPQVTLGIKFKTLPDMLFFDKFECSSLAAKFSKIFQRCKICQSTGA